MDLTSLHGMVLNDFMKALKAEVEDQILANPGNSEQIKAEEKAILHYWKMQKDSWIVAGKTKAAEIFERTPEKKRRLYESSELEQANVSFSNLEKIHYTQRNIDIQKAQTHHNRYTIHRNTKSSTTKDIQSQLQKHQFQSQLPGQSLQSQPSKHSSSKHSFSKFSSSKHTHQSQLLGTPLQSQFQLQLQRKSLQSKLQRNSFQSQLQGKKALHKKNGVRRISRSKKNSIRNVAKQSNLFNLEINEYNVQKHNLIKLGVAQTNIHNINNISLSEKEANALALGHKFIPTPKKKVKHIEEANELFRRTIRWRCIFRNEISEIPQYWIPSDKQPSPTHYELEQILTKCTNNIVLNEKQSHRNFSHKQYTQIYNLLHKENILIITADKNLGYAITTTVWYKQQCLEHLESASYIEVTNQFNQNDNGQSFTQELYSDLVDLTNSATEILTTEEIKWILQIKDWSPMKFYILAKVHKLPIRSRPIVPSMTWITHSISEWIANQLNPLMPYLEWVLKDSNDLLKTIHNINTSKTLKNKYINIEIYSADVEALYPNMDIATGLMLTQQFLEETIQDTARIQFIIKAMEFVLTKGYIIFQDRIFQQRNGAAMGSPMIPPYANIYMYMLEKQTVYKYKKSNLLILYKRFIDDILIIVQTYNNTHLSNLQNNLNSLHPKIKLTWTDKVSHVNFLDLTIWNSHKNHIYTTVYQKPLNMYSYLPYHSYHTPSQKTGFIKGEALRYSRICSRKVDFSNMIQLFTIRLQRRGYPLKIIQNALKSVKWENRIKHLFKPSKKQNLPLLYKIQFTPSHDHTKLRKTLNDFTIQMKNHSLAPNSIKEKITICYKLPPKLHNLVLKARKDKGY